MVDKLSETANQAIKPDAAGNPDALASEIPPMALGPYGDIPAAYAVLRIDLDEEAHKATDARYVFASDGYCQTVRRSNVGLVGRSHLKVGETDEEKWLAQCYRVVVDGETVSGFEYNPLVREWTCYTLTPSAIEGCCTYAFIVAAIDEQQRKQLVSSTDARTSLAISEMLSTLSSEQSYEAAMSGMLRMMSDIIQADRLMVFECGGLQTKVTFELCAEGVKPQLGMVFPLSKDGLRRWFRTVAKDPVALVPDVSILEKFNTDLYQWCQASNISSLMVAPFFNDGEIVGFLGAYNYQIDEEVDLNRLFAAISAFIGARIDNRRLIDSLAWAGAHDALTGLLNRRGIRTAIDERLREQPDAPHVLAIADVDDFKMANDTYGHYAGDEALCTLSRIMTESFPEDALISRHGGDEFLMMLSGDAAKNSDELIGAFSRKQLEYEYEGERHPLAVSIGYACYPDQADAMRELYAMADAALYDVKNAGKAGYKRYEAATPA